MTAIILAAGAGRRMGGRPKALLAIDGATFLERVARTCREAGAGRIVVVTRAEPPEIGRLARSLDAVTVVNRQPERGMFSSVRLGIAAAIRSAGLDETPDSPPTPDPPARAAAGGASAVPAAAVDSLPAPAPRPSTDPAPRPAADPAPAGLLLFPVDHPRVTPETVAALVRALPEKPANTWLRPVHEGRGGHPILLDGAAAIALLERDPDEPLRDALRGLGLTPHDVPVDDPGILANLNRPEDLG